MEKVFIKLTEVINHSLSSDEFFNFLPLISPVFQTRQNFPPLVGDEKHSRSSYKILQENTVQ